MAKPVSRNHAEPCQPRLMQELNLIQLCNFLNHMAFGVDLDELKPLTAGLVTNPSKFFAEYVPMRRKLSIDDHLNERS